MRRSTPHIAVLAGRQVGIGGSVPRIAAEQANHLADHFQVTVIAKKVAGLRPDVDVWPLRAPDLHWLRRFSHPPRELVLSRGLKTALARLHAQRPLDLVLCNSHTAAAWAAGPLKRAAGVPFAVVTHGDIFQRPRGTYGPSLTWLYQRATVEAYRHADLVVASSPFMAECARDGGASPEAIEVIPNGIAPGPDEPAGGRAVADSTESHAEGEKREPTSAGGVRFLFVGHVLPVKNVPLLLRAFHRLDPDAGGHSLTVVGDGHQLRECVELADTLGLGDVEFRGHVPADSLPAVYRAHDVFCITSVDDPLPTVVLEAMREGLPVIGTDAGGIPFMVRHGATGLIVPSDDVDALARAMRTLADDVALRRRLGEQGRRRAARTFSWPGVAEQLAAAIRARIPDPGPA